MSTGDKKIALVIGSGAVMCAASLGLCRVLQREGLDLSMAVGCSGGSLYAAALALGYDLPTTEALTLDLWRSDVYAGYADHLKDVLSGERRFSGLSGLIDDEILLTRLEQAFGERTFAETRIPLHLVATDLHSGERVVLNRGRIVDAVRASLAIPLLFAPWPSGERLLVDGAVSDPLPVDVAIQEGAAVILAMGFELPTPARLRSYTAVTAHFNSLYMNNILKSSFAFHTLAHHSEVIPVLPEFDRQVGTFDTRQLPYVIEQGARAAEGLLPYLGRLLGTPG